METVSRVGGLKANASAVFELSWEVCNKVGGIYAVITSKAALMKKYYQEYYAIGPYFEKKAEEEFSEEPVPSRFVEAFNELRAEGIIPHYGSWLIKGEPKVILLDFSGIYWMKNQLKKEFWDYYRVDSLFSGWEFEEPMLFSCAAAFLLMKLEHKKIFVSGSVVLHAHEWLSGFAILKLRKEKSSIRTVFTTHATMLGRSVSSNSQNLYSSLGQFDPFQKAKDIGIIDKFTAERAAAQKADIFTTVSEITGSEAEIILGRKPEVLVLNGLDMENFPSLEDASIKHVTSRELIREFLAYTFFPYYKFKLQRNLSFFIAGRYEFENKGMDIFIEALGILNRELKKMNSDRTISALFLVAMPNNGVKMEFLENKNYYRHINNYVHQKSHELITKIVNDFLSQENPYDSLFNKEFLHEMKKDVLRFRRKGSPPFCTHRLSEIEENNSVIKAFRNAGLNNIDSDPVKVLLVPAYLDGNDGLFNMEFYDVVAGCHLGVFPSYYEPWGYTPLESAALGVPAVTTDLAGFGRFVKPVSNSFPEDERGIYVVNRENISRQDCVSQVYDILYRFSLMEHSLRVDNKIRAKELASLADWRLLIKNYILAHNLALEKKI